MDKDTFNTIRRALHPDSRNSISDKKLADASRAFMASEKYILNEIGCRSWADRAGRRPAQPQGIHGRARVSRQRLQIGRFRRCSLPALQQ